VHVWSTETGPRTASVERATEGSTGAAHAIGATVYANPRFSRFDIFEAVNEELDDLSTYGLFRVPTPITLTFTAAVQGYDLTAIPSNFIDILDVFIESTGTAKDWPRLNSSSWEIRRDMAAADFASGSALVLYEPGYAGRDIRVSYKAPFTNVTSGTEDVNTVSGLPATCNDILSMGAAIRLAAPMEIKRNRTENQGDTRRAEEVPPGAQGQSWQGLAIQREARIARECDRLAEKYPHYLAVTY
jgi:hypothetical protein